MARRDTSMIFVGKKPLMSYVLATVMQLSTDAAEAVIKARGRAISKAVDVAEIVRNKFLTNTLLEKIEIGTEVLKNTNGNNANVSFIEIYMSKTVDTAPAPTPSTKE